MQLTLSYDGRLAQTNRLQGAWRGSCGDRTAPEIAALLRGAVVFAAASLLLCGSAAGLEAALGDTIPLAGTAYGGSYVYLFLTGPNLPSDGVALDDVTLPAGQGGLTRVRIGDNDRWEYDWDTHATGGRLDAGTYTIWITTIPAGRSQLRSGEYRTLSVTLRSPGLSVSTPAHQTGAVSFQSDPPGASVTMDGQYRGTTPLDLTGLVPGTYTATLSRFGYSPLDLRVTVEAAAMTEVDATLLPATGSLALITDPAGARVMLDGRDAGTAPLTLSDLPAGNHTLSAHREGYITAQETVTVVSGQTLNVTLLLAPAGGTPRSTSAGSPAFILLISVGAGMGVAALIAAKKR